MKTGDLYLHTLNTSGQKSPKPTLLTLPTCRFCHRRATQGLRSEMIAEIPDWAVSGFFNHVQSQANNLYDLNNEPRKPPLLGASTKAS